MKTIKKIALAIIAMLLISSFSKAQLLFYAPHKSLYEVKKDMEKYFADQVKKYGKSIIEGEGSEYAMYQRWLTYWEPKLFPDGNFETYFAAEEAFNRTYSADMLMHNGDPWFEIGPKQKPPCGYTSIGGGAVGIGPIQFMNFYAPNPDYILCGSGSGGIFYSIDAGNSWNNGNSDVLWNRSGCSSAAFSANNEQVWYASQSGYIGYIRGIWRTTNQGTNWEQIADQNQLNGVWTQVLKVVTNLNNTDELYAATSDGFYLSTNCTASPGSSVTWTKTLDGYVNDLEIQACPSCSQSILYASVRDDANVWAIWQSVDGGNTWNILPGLPSTTGVTYITMELTLNPSFNYMYCLFDFGNSSANDYLYQFNYNTLAWNLQSTNRFVNMGGGRGFGVSNFDENTVYLTDAGYAGIYYSKSTDGGVTWTVNYGSSQYHVDIEDIVCHPTIADEVWMTNHGGVAKSADQGGTWSDKSKGLGVAEAIGMSSSITDPSYVIIGTFHDGTMLTNTTYVDPWYPDWCTVYGGDGMQPRIDYSDPKNMWASAQSGSYGLSQSYGAAYTYSGTQLPAEWFAYMIQNSRLPNYVYGRGPSGGTVENIKRSNDRGISNIETISDFSNAPLSIPGQILPWKFFSSTADGNYLYVHLRTIDLSNVEHHYIVRTRRALDPLTSVLPSWEMCFTPQNKWIGDIETDPYNPNVIYVTYNGYDVATPGVAGPMVFRIDYSTGVMTPVVTDMTYNLPASNALQLIKEKGPNGDLYLGTDFGVFYTNSSRITINTGNEWVLFGSELPNCGVNGLEANHVINKLRAGTWGRGVWEHGLYCPDQANLILSGVVSASEYQEASNSITSTASINSPVTVIYRAGNSISLNPGFSVGGGANFNAFIEPCDHSVYGLRSGFTDLTDENLYKPEDEEVSNKQVRLYPNPGTDLFYLAKNFDEDCKIEVFDGTGRLVYSRDKISEDISSFNLGAEKSGIFFVRITSGDETFSTKLIKN
jgi:hypothetical protein